MYTVRKPSTVGVKNENIWGNTLSKVHNRNTRHVYAKQADGKPKKPLHLFQVVSRIQSRLLERCYFPTIFVLCHKRHFPNSRILEEEKWITVLEYLNRIKNPIAIFIMVSIIMIFAIFFRSFSFMKLVR